jgi:pyruvate kinase
VANAIFDGTDAVMLSGETAAGQYPVEAVKMMHKIALCAEKELNHKEILSVRSKQTEHNMTDAICQSVAHTAINLDIHAVITPTESGHTARMIAKYRPKSPIIAITSNERTRNQLELVWGVYPLLGEKVPSTDEMLELSVQESLKSGLIKHGDIVVITAGVPVGEAGTTNMMKIHVVGDILLKGQGVGRKTAFGKAVIARNSQEALEKVKERSILVTYSTDREMMPAIEKCIAIVTEEGGITSHAAVVGLSLGIPVIVGAEKAVEVLKDGQEITVDAVSGIVYKGHASVL